MTVSLSGPVRWLSIPHRLHAVRDIARRPGAIVLDVGCGNHSPSVTKRFFPLAEYHGIDQVGPEDKSDIGAVDKFFQLNLDEVDISRSVTETAYDAIIFSHVIEHLSEPHRVAEQLASKLRPGGKMYIESPARVSLRLPRAENGWFGIKGCLNFYDDPTHRELVDLQVLRRALIDQGYEVSRVRRRLLWRRVVLLPGYVVVGILSRGYVPASVVWDVTGFAQWITVEGR